MAKLNLNLFQNGLDSLRHSVEHFLEDNEFSLKYSILHLAQAVELFLKERLSREHKLLIFSKPELANENAKTVTLDESIKRLSAAGIQLSKEAKMAFEELQKRRNKIQHYEVNIEKKEVELEIGRNTKYLIEFLREELSVLLEDHLPDKIYTSLRNTIYTYNELDKLYKNELEKFCQINNIESEPELCPDCGHYSIVFPDPRYPKNDKVKCFYCKDELEVYKCHKCGVTCFLKENIYHDCTLTDFSYGIN